MQINNVVCIVLDSLRKDHVSWFDADWVDTETPAIDEFAADPNTVAFTNSYPEALPTLPTRRTLFTGQRSLPFGSSNSLVDTDRTLQQLLRQHGYTTSLVTDTYHLAKPGMNFHRGFDSFEWIRGQEGDSYRTAPHDENLDSYVGHPSVREQTDQYLRNVSDRDDGDEGAYFAARVVKRGINWLEANKNTDKFFLWIDSFDPHEPWDPPQSYLKKHVDPDYDGPHLILPRIGSSERMSPEEIEYVRGLYAAMVEYTSHWIGQLIQKLKNIGLYDSTLIVLLSDHGAPLGEHGYMRKSGGDLYSELLDIPLFIKPPTDLCISQGFIDTVDELVRLDDLPATLLEMVGLERGTATMHGRSLLPLMRDDQQNARDTIVTGYHNDPVRCVRDERWSFIYRPEAKNELYDIENDPREQNNVIEEKSAKAESLTAQLEPSFRIPQSSPGLNRRASDRD